MLAVTPYPTSSSGLLLIIQLANTCLRCVVDKISIPSHPGISATLASEWELGGYHHNLKFASSLRSEKQYARQDFIQRR